MRIDFIDKLRGVAIILVVMGHVIEKGLGIYNTISNLCYVTFHMPLFMFLSGLFAIKGFEKWNSSETVIYIKKKICRLIIPFLTVGGIYSFKKYHCVITVLLGEDASYWFLPALFYCMMLELLVGYLYYRFFPNGFLFDFGIHAVGYSIVVLFYVFISSKVPFLLYFIKMYPFFVIGAFYNKYNRVQAVCNSKILFTSSLALFFVCIYLQTILKLPFLFSGFFAIVLLINLFREYDSSISPSLAKLGKATLPIYVLHWFFLPSILPIGDYISSIGGGDDQFLITLTISFIITVPIILICCIIYVILKRSKILNLLLFGGV